MSNVNRDRYSIGIGLVSITTIQRVYITPLQKPKHYLKCLVVLISLMSVFIMIASHSTLRQSRRPQSNALRQSSTEHNAMRQSGTEDNVSVRENDSIRDVTGSHVNQSQVTYPLTNRSQEEQGNDIVIDQPLLQSPHESPDKSVGNRCEPQHNIAFIKTHKTGSTTIASILNRYALDNQLSCLAFLSDPMRGHIRQARLKKTSSRKFLPPLGVKKGDYARYRDYNMLTVHVRYQPKILNHFMAKGTQYVTILREPSSHFESAFSFFEAEQVLFGRVDKSANVAKFAKNPQHYWDKLRARTHKKMYTRNGQLFDLTLDKRIHSDKAVVQDIIKSLAKKFSLVMIMEYMDESLLLLNKLMCWSFKDISYVMKNQRAHSSKMAANVRASLRKWNWADTLLYEHFNATFWKRVEAYGPTFNDDLATFREVLSKDYNTCVANEVASKGKNRIKTQLAQKSEYCTNLAGSQYGLFNRIYKRQMKKA